MARPPIKALFLDAGNTLFTERVPRVLMYSCIAHEFGGHDHPEEMGESMSMAFRELPQSIGGNFRFSLEWFRHFNSRVLTENNVPATQLDKAHERIVEVFEDPQTYTLFEEVPDFLRELAAMDLQVGILSNWSERLPLLCEKLGLSQHVQFVIASADIRAEKPDRSAFERALFRAGVPASEAIHIGDHPSRDVNGALNAGLRVALISRGSVAEPAVPPADGIPILQSLEEALPLLTTGSGQANHQSS
ncbi:MAG: HAD-IA family hydrolase [Planctomycetes bacterium]|nr:HAD-IA family hydrolase [Planctomycetota bacterium]NQU47979.1 HAD-IA family hydrolase [Planctomycetota bacterium]